MSNVNGSSVQKLTNNDVYDAYPSAAGSWPFIVFGSSFDAGLDEPPDIYLLNPETESLVRLTANSLCENFPALSPDENGISFWDIKEKEQLEIKKYLEGKMNE